MAPRYTITDLSAGVDALSIHPADINDHGQIVGKLFRGEKQANGISIWHAFLWQAGELTILPTLGGATSVAQAINNRGDIVGSSRTAAATDENPVTHAFLYRDGVIRDLGTLGGPKSFAHGISDNGLIVGGSTVEGLDGGGRANYYACLWDAGAVNNLGDLGGGYSTAHDIDDSGKIIGLARLPSREQHAVFWFEGSIRALGPPGSTRSVAWSINAKGDIAGGSYTPGGLGHATLWRQGGEVIDLGIVGRHTSTALAINDQCQVVGRSGFTNRDRITYPERAFLWQKDQLYDLNDLIPAVSGWQLFEAKAINNAAAIVGRGFLNDEVRAFLLTPA